MIELIRSNRKTISLMIKDDGSLMVRAPRRTRIEYVNKFLEDKQDWIAKHKDMMQDFLRRRKSHKFINSKGILYLGRRIKPKGVNLRSYDEIKSWYKKRAKTVFTRKIDNFSAEFGLKYGKLKITDAKKRWGSCSGRNNINLSWRLLMASNKAIDYVIIHELAHIKHKDHSVRFWNYVESMMKNYKKYDNWLEENRFLLDF